MKVKLQEEARNALAKAKGEKDTKQQIRLICNIITPDNFDKKFKELRRHTFGEAKLKEEAGYDPKID